MLQMNKSTRLDRTLCFYLSLYDAGLVIQSVGKMSTSIYDDATGANQGTNATHLLLQLLHCLVAMHLKRAWCSYKN